MLREAIRITNDAAIERPLVHVNEARDCPPEKDVDDWRAVEREIAGGQTPFGLGGTA